MRLLRQYIYEVVNGSMRGSLRFSMPSPLRYGVGVKSGGNVLDDAAEENITEAAKSLSDVSDLALFVTHGDWYVLYSPTILIEALKKSDQLPTDAMYAAMSVMAHPFAAEVMLSVARKGYGPLMYDIVMSDMGGIFANRDSVSNKARAVWYYYANKRPDVKSNPLPKDFYMTGAEVLDRFYTIDKKLDVSGLVQNHEQFKSTFASLDLPYKKLEPLLVNTADSFFELNYEE